MYTSLSAAASAFADGPGDGLTVTGVERDAVVAGGTDGWRPIEPDAPQDAESPAVGEDFRVDDEEGDGGPSSPVATLDGSEIFERSVPGGPALEPIVTADEEAGRWRDVAGAEPPLPNPTRIADAVADELGGRSRGVARFFDGGDDFDLADAVCARLIEIEMDHVVGGEETRHEGIGRPRAGTPSRVGNRSRNARSTRAADAVRVRASAPVQRPVRSRRCFGWWFRRPRKPRR